jgi:hypothetical protein
MAEDPSGCYNLPLKDDEHGSYLAPHRLPYQQEPIVEA